MGERALERLYAVHVAVFGVGGVGSWCAEALVRSGVNHLTLIDDDVVAASNINRQRQARPSTLGRSKVEALREMLLETVPDARIDICAERYTPQTADSFDGLLAGCDFVIDAIDSVECKAHLIWRCTCGGGPAIFSSMGAALRTDPTQVRMAPFRKVAGDGLARALRARFRKGGIPMPDHLCIYSAEPPNARGSACKGSVMTVTCAFGMALASLVLAAMQQQA